MLQRTVSYKSLLVVLGVCLLLYGLYSIALVLTAHIVATDADGVTYSGPVLFEDPMDVENHILYGGLFLAGNPVLPVLPGSLNALIFLTPGPLLWVGLATLCLSAMSRRVQIVYVGLQIALWLISLSLWFPILFLLGSSTIGLGSLGPFWLVTLALSLLLLALYKPVVQVLSRLLYA